MVAKSVLRHAFKSGAVEVDASHAVTLTKPGAVTSIIEQATRATGR
ncbi:hypothetical protein ACQP25_26615 [Microtetraspora malaysiensis]